MTILLFVISLLVAQQPGQPEFGSLSGQLRGENGAPAAGIRIAAAPVDADLAIAETPTELSNIVQTDNEGRYRMENVRPGRYLIVAGSLTSPSYFPGSTTADKGRIVTVTAGQSITRLDFTIALVSSVISGASPPSPITGKARFDDGTPLQRLSSLNILFTTSAGGRVGRATMNSLQPGALAITSVSAPSTLVVTVAPLPLGYYLKSMTFGNVDLTRAPLVLTSNQGNPSLEVVFTRTRPAGTPPGVKVSGRISNENPAEPKSAFKAFALYNVTNSTQPFGVVDVAQVEIMEDGSFEINDVPPGRYTLDSNYPVKPGRVFDVGRNDIANLDLKIGRPEFPVTLTPSSLTTIQGTVDVADGMIPQFEIQFVTREGAATRTVKISGKEFSVLLPQGAYRVRLSGLPAGYAVSVSAGPLDLTELFLVTAAGIADRFTGVAMRSAEITVKLRPAV